MLVWNSTHNDLSYENINIWGIFWQGSAKNIKVVKTGTIVAETDEGQPIHIYLQHRSIKIIYL